MRSVSVCVVAVATVVLCAGIARAQGSKTPVFAAASAANVKKLTPEQRQEWRFLKEAAAASRFESDASRMALAKSKDPGVRALATALVQQHTATGLDLQHMLQGRGMAPPMLSNDQRKTLNRLAKLSGPKFDRAYAGYVGVRYQQEDLQVYERAAAATRDPALKNWIERQLPTLRSHLAMAESLAGSEQAAPVKVRARRNRSASRLRPALAPLA